MKSTVKDVMTTRVVWVKKSASFREMARALRANRISAFPVLDDEGKVIGVVSEADMLTKEALGGEHNGLPGMVTGLLHHKDRVKARGITAGDLMTTPAVTIGPEDTLEHAARLMYTRKVKRIPVVDADGHLAGIVSRADVLAVFDRPDEDIRREVNAEIFFDQVLGDPDRLSVSVKGRRGDPGRHAGDRSDRPRDRGPDPAHPGRGGRTRPPQLSAAQGFRLRLGHHVLGRLMPAQT
jgi:CBS domain-containing protein